MASPFASFFHSQGSPWPTQMFPVHPITIITTTDRIYWVLLTCLVPGPNLGPTVMRGMNEWMNTRHCLKDLLYQLSFYPQKNIARGILLLSPFYGKTNRLREMKYCILGPLRSTRRSMIFFFFLLPISGVPFLSTSSEVFSAFILPFPALPSDVWNWSTKMIHTLLSLLLYICARQLSQGVGILCSWVSPL